MNEEELRKLAKRRLKDKADFRQYLFIWLGVSLLLIAIWAITSATVGDPLYFWPAWPIGGMGVAAFFMGLNAYGPQSNYITDDKITAEMDKIRGKQNGTV
jgi:hypothetical protein